MRVRAGTGASAAPEAPKRRRHRPEVRRALILEAAKQCIAESGLAATTAREVAARCGISTGTLTHHYPSMDDLLVQALRSGSKEFTDQNVAALESRSGAVDRLRYLIDTALPDQADAQRNWRLWLEYWARAVHEPTLAALQTERYREWRGVFERVIREGIETRELVDVDPERTAKELVGLFDGLGVQAMIGDEAVTVDEARAILYEFIDTRLRRRRRARTPAPA